MSELSPSTVTLLTDFPIRYSQVLNVARDYALLTQCWFGIHIDHRPESPLASQVSVKVVFTSSLGNREMDCTLESPDLQGMVTQLVEAIQDRLRRVQPHLDTVEAIRKIYPLPTSTTESAPRSTDGDHGP